MFQLNRRHLLQAALAGATPAAFAQPGFPSRPIKFIVPYPPGGATDLVGRLLAAKLQESWGQTVVVENKPGASGMIGSEQVARAAPDGHTVLVAITTHIQNPAIFAKVPYDPLKDFEPVSQICLSYLVLVVKPDFPANNLKEFVALVKANPGKYSFGSFGIGSSSHIVGETFARKAALDLAHVACGRLDGFWEFGLNPWDMAAGCLLIEEAGGLVGDFCGGQTQLDSGHILAATPKIHDQLLALIAPHVPDSWCARS
jgi:tripartite-type tricarboxylate transporter receptor subunit TctC